MRHFLVKLLSWVLVLAGLYFCVSKLHSNFRALPDIKWNIVLVAKLAMIIPLILLTGIIFTFGWLVLLKATSTAISFMSTYTIIGKSQIGKYLPFNVFHYVGRVAMGIKAGIPSTVIASTISIETILVVAVTGMLIVVGGLTDNRIYAYMLHGMDLVKTIYMLLAIIIFVLTVGYYFRANVCCEYIKGYINRPALLIKVFFLYVTIFVVYGIIFKLIPWAMWGKFSSVTVTNAIWRFALCYLAGFIVPGAPAGLGVREAMFTKLFAPELGEGGAACVALVFRVLTTIGDLVTFCSAWLVGKHVLGKIDLIDQEVQ